uniref:Piwi domain-containing protein n=1 Tax=Glossina morsitans morsitans TaxID=37546 RepID=A0ABK9MF89_GLOMM
MNIDLMPDVAYHYDVTIKPDFPKKIFHLVFDQFQKQHFGDCTMAFDGFNTCYTLKRLPEKSYVFDIEATDSTSHIKTFKIHIKESETPEVDLSSLRTYQKERSFDKPVRALQVLEVVLASNNHALGIRAGRSFYRKSRSVYDLGDCYEMCTGIYQVPLLGEVPLLNVDISYKSFPKSQSLIQCLRDYRIDPGRTMEGGRTKESLLQFLKGIYITYSPPPGFAALPKTYKVLDIGDVPARIRFKPFGGPEISVMDYFQWKGCPLRYPDLNCIETINKISLPMEFCSITEDQVLNRKDGKVQATKMSAYAAISTNERKDKIMNLLTHFSHNDNSTIKAFGVQLAPNFVKINYRILQPPQLEYFNGKIVRPSDGAWKLASIKFLETSKASQGHKWAIIFEKKSRSSISFHKVVDFKKALQRTGQELGVNLAEQCDIIDFQEIEKALEHFAKNGYALVVVIISSYGASYSTIKQKAELRIGILTQCIKESTVLRVSTDKSIMTNLMLKINAKLNGTNHKVSEEREDELKKLLQPMRDIMFMGADVIQPSLDQRHMPSVVGVTASHDAYGACYNTQYSLQKSNVEFIEGMKLIAKKVLIVYKTHQGRYPNHIIYYRGGISAGLYAIIKKQELRGIHEACAQLACGPLLTCIVVIKKHRTRFFPLLQAKGGKDFNNVQPGSVMDQYIVHPNERQFFLVSHKTIQGTARPTRYSVIQDDANFDIDLLQKLTYNMCHMSPRCNKALSYPAPAYLAHIAACRARIYLEGATNFDNLKEENEKCSVQPSLKNRNPMFFV